MRVGLFGLGRMGAVHAANLAATDGVTLVVTDLDAGLTAAVAARLGCESRADADELWQAGLDAVVIAAATDAHPPLLSTAVRRRIPVFCEKPVAGDPVAAAALRDTLRGSDVPVLIGYPRRFDPAFVAARDAVRSGELGRLTTVRSTTLDPAPAPAAYLAVSGGIFRDCAVHDFDAVRWVTGREVVEVYATGSVDPTAPSEMFLDHGDVSTAAAILTLDDGTLGVVSATRYNGRGYDVRLEVHGSADSVAAGLEDKLPLRSTEPGATFPSGTPHTFFMDRLATAFAAEMAAFLEVATGSHPSPCTIEDAIETTWVSEAAALSQREHRPVRVEEVRR